MSTVHATRVKPKNDNQTSRESCVLDGTKLALIGPEIKLRSLFWLAAIYNETGDGHPGSAPIQIHFKPRHP
jgi:hypothetical protein